MGINEQNRPPYMPFFRQLIKNQPEMLQTHNIYLWKQKNYIGRQFGIAVWFAVRAQKDNFWILLFDYRAILFDVTDSIDYLSNCFHDPYVHFWFFFLCIITPMNSSRAITSTYYAKLSTCTKTSPETLQSIEEMTMAQTKAMRAFKLFLQRWRTPIFTKT